jgi:membrane protease YdiL (CAAX protease family)
MVLLTLLGMMGLKKISGCRWSMKSTPSTFRPSWGFEDVAAFVFVFIFSASLLLKLHQSALDQAQADAAIQLNLITKSALPRAVTLREEWQSAKHSGDLAEAIAEVAKLSPTEAQSIRDEGKPGIDEITIRFLVQILSALVTLLVCWAILHLRRTSRDDFKFRPPTMRDLGLATLSYLTFLPIFLLLIVMTWSLHQLSGRIPANQDILVQYQDAFQVGHLFRLLLIATTIVVVAPLLEEIFFRGLLLPVLVRHLGPSGGILGSAVLFSIIHLESTAILPILGFGILLAWISLKTNSLFVPIFIHLLHNALTLVLASFSSP